MELHLFVGQDKKHHLVQEIERALQPYKDRSGSTLRFEIENLYVVWDPDIEVPELQFLFEQAEDGCGLLRDLPNSDIPQPLIISLVDKLYGNALYQNLREGVYEHTADKATARILVTGYNNRGEQIRLIEGLSNDPSVLRELYLATRDGGADHRISRWTDDWDDHEHLDISALKWTLK